jgi:hypothetical protein
LLLVEVLHRGKVFKNEEYRKKSAVPILGWHQHPKIEHSLPRSSPSKRLLFEGDIESLNQPMTTVLDSLSKPVLNGHMLTFTLSIFRIPGLFPPFPPKK